MVNYAEKLKVIVHLADVHIGCRSLTPDEFKSQLKKGVIKKLRKMQLLNGIVISGDLLDGRLSLDSEYSNVFFWFVGQLVKECKKRENNPFLIICKGTDSHDEDQLENIRFYEEDDDIFFRIYNTLDEVEVDGMKIAIIPEEYVSNQEEYYKELFDKPDDYYDLAFGHGMVSECAFMSQESENHSTKAPIFDSIDFDRIVKGPVCFGHIHKPTNLRDKFFYVGSTLRLCHGEEEEKGFNIILYIPETSDYYVDKIVNEFTFNFNTLNITSARMDTCTVDELVDDIMKFKEESNAHKLSLKFKCIETEEVMAKIQILKKYFNQFDDIKTSFKVMSKQAYEKEEEKEQKKEKKEYLKDGLSITERIKLWAYDKKKINIDEERIARFLKINKS